MAYPTTTFSQTDVTGTTLLASDDHSARHNDVGAELVAIETTLGTNSGTAILKNFTDGKFAARTVGETFGTNTWIGGTIGTTIIGTSTIQSGTVRNAIIGTSTIQGGTANLLDLRGYISTPQYATAAGTGGTTTLDLSLTNEWRITFGTGNGTLAVSNAVDGKKFLVSLTQDAVGTRTVVWFSTVKWTDGNGTPTLTVTANKQDTFGFICTSGSTFDGYIVGQNI
jgi:hypothetical protein